MSEYRKNFQRKVILKLALEEWLTIDKERIFL